MWWSSFQGYISLFLTHLKRCGFLCVIFSFEQILPVKVLNYFFLEHGCSALAAVTPSTQLLNFLSFVGVLWCGWARGWALAIACRWCVRGLEGPVAGDGASLLPASSALRARLPHPRRGDLLLHHLCPRLPMDHQ